MLGGAAWSSHAPRDPPQLFSLLQREGTLPDGMFEKSASPRKAYAAVHGASPFVSLGYRFDTAGHLQSLPISQLPPSERRTTPHYHGAPGRYAPFAPAAASLVPLGEARGVHAEKLAAARKSIERPGPA